MFQSDSRLRVKFRADDNRTAILGQFDSRLQRPPHVVPGLLPLPTANARNDQLCAPRNLRLPLSAAKLAAGLKNRIRRTRQNPQRSLTAGWHNLNRGLNSQEPGQMVHFLAALRGLSCGERHAVWRESL